MYSKRTIFIAFSSDIIHAIRIVFIFLKITVFVVKADGPEGIHRHVLDGELIGALSASILGALLVIGNIILLMGGAY